MFKSWFIFSKDQRNYETSSSAYNLINFQNLIKAMYHVILKSLHYN